MTPLVIEFFGREIGIGSAASPTPYFKLPRSCCRWGWSFSPIPTFHWTSTVVTRVFLHLYKIVIFDRTFFLSYQQVIIHLSWHCNWPFQSKKETLLTFPHIARDLLLVRSIFLHIFPHSRSLQDPVILQSCIQKESDPFTPASFQQEFNTEVYFDEVILSPEVIKTDPPLPGLFTQNFRAGKREYQLSTFCWSWHSSFR